MSRRHTDSQETCATIPAGRFDYYGGNPQTGGYFFDFSFYLLMNLGSDVLHAELFGPIRNREPGVGTDRFEFDAFSDWGVAEPDMVYDPDPDRWRLYMNFQLIDADGTALTHGGVPEELPGSEGEIVSLPEPAQVALLAVGLPVLALLGRLRGRHRQ